MKTTRDLKNLDIDKIANAVEMDAGQALPGLRESLAEAKAGKFADVHTPAEIKARRRGRPVGSTATVRKIPTTIRFDPDVLEGLRATGRGWQTRANDALREWLREHQK